MSDLKDKLVKLAFDKPELRAELLPLIKEAGIDPDFADMAVYKGGYIKLAHHLVSKYSGFKLAQMGEIVKSPTTSTVAPGTVALSFEVREKGYGQNKIVDSIFIRGLVANGKKSTMGIHSHDSFELDATSLKQVYGFLSKLLKVSKTYL